MTAIRILNAVPTIVKPRPPREIDDEWECPRPGSWSVKERVQDKNHMFRGAAFCREIRITEDDEIIVEMTGTRALRSKKI
jgi:hypothetical protein